MRAHSLVMIPRTQKNRRGKIRQIKSPKTEECKQLWVTIILCVSKKALLLVFIPVFMFHKASYFYCLFASTAYFFPDTAYTIGEIYVDSVETAEVILLQFCSSALKKRNEANQILYKYLILMRLSCDKMVLLDH